MTSGRLEAFSDGVIAILITIMVLELRVPHGTDWTALRPLAPKLITYLLSFVHLAIYWNNHHHLFHAVDRVDGRILWANTHLLFWLSLIPFVTGWMGENYFAPIPTAGYGLVLLCAGVAFWILVRTMVARLGPHSKLAQAIGRDYKGRLSIGLYAAGVAMSFVNRWIALGIYAAVAAMWLVPDPRIERRLTD